MGKFLKNIVLFLGFFLLVYTVALLITIMVPKIFYLTPNIKSSRGGYAHSLERFQELNNYPKKEVLLIGSSHAYRGFDPRILFPEGNSFNLGNSAQTPYVTFHLLQSFLDSIQPKKVIYEAYWGPLSASSSSVESSIDVISNKPINYGDIKMVLGQKNILSFNSLNYSMIKNLIDPIDTTDIEYFDFDSYIAGGYVSKTSNKGYLSNTNNLNFPSKNIELNDYQIKYLVKCIELCKKKNVEFVALRTPVMSEYISSFENFIEISEFTDSLFKSHQVKYQDFCSKSAIEQMKLKTDEDFSDAHHLTQSGVEKFNSHWMAYDSLGIFK